jgi:uncharacterized protein (TIGR02996 family)
VARAVRDHTPPLVREVDRAPDDLGAQLVLADWLISQDDPRGELILLDHRDRSGELDDPAGIEQLLLLAAEYTFPCARPSDDEPIVFVGGGAMPVQYDARFRGHEYFIRYRHGDLSAEVDDGEIRTGVEYPNGYPQELGLAFDGEWTDEETALLLDTFRDAIRAGSPLGELWFPTEPIAPPTYDAGARRCYRLPADFTEPRGISRDRYGLAARDYDRWYALSRRVLLSL